MKTLVNGILRDLDAEERAYRERETRLHGTIDAEVMRICQRYELESDEVYTREEKAYHIVDQIKRGYLALGDAQKALCECAPNARDYYVQAPGAIEQAGREHRARIDAITDIQKELEDIAEHIA